MLSAIQGMVLHVKKRRPGKIPGRLRFFGVTGASCTYSICSDCKKAMVRLTGHIEGYLRKSTCPSM